MYINSNKVKKIKMLCEKKHIDIVLSGGGARGIEYTGVFAALVDCNILDQVTSFSGTSAGAFSSALIATGISKEDFYRLTSEYNIQNLFNTNPSHQTIWNDGKPLHDFMAREIYKNILRYLDSINDIHKTIDSLIIELKKKLDDYDLDLKKRYDELVKIQNDQYQAVDNLKSKEPNKVTFKDLSILRLINPQKFKELNITCTKQDTLQEVVFNAQNSPDIEIADAVRASISIPYLFIPYTIKGLDYIDGGIVDNIPMDCVTSKSENHRNIIFAFNGGFFDPSSAIYSNKSMVIAEWVINNIIAVLPQHPSVIKLITTFIQSSQKEYDELRENALNIVVLNANDISMLSFDQAMKEFLYLDLAGYLTTRQYLENHFLIKTLDQNLPIKMLLLNLYLDLSGKSDKAESILNFAREEYWIDKDNKKFLLDFISSICPMKDGKLNFDNPFIKQFIDIFNSSSMPLNLKSQFIQLLDPNFDTSWDNITARIIDFKFDIQDFENFMPANELDDSFEQL